MKNRSFLNVALIVIAVLAILAVCAVSVVISTSPGSPYDAGLAFGKMIRPYLVGLGFVFFILILIRLVKKYS